MMERVASLTERSGVLVLRIWTESGLVDDLRARISSRVEGGPATRDTAVAGSSDEILAVVARFLEGFLDEPA
jgi:hypothetical protein